MPPVKNGDSYPKFTEKVLFSLVLMLKNRR